MTRPRQQILPCIAGLLLNALLAVSLHAPVAFPRLSDSVHYDDDARAFLQRRSQLEGALLSGIINGSSDDESKAFWDSYQRYLDGEMQRTFPASHNASFRILVVSPVKGTSIAVEGFRYNMRKLMENKAGDTFDFALFHYDNDASEWLKHRWYTNADGPVVLRRIQPLCKAQAWTLIEPDMAKRYDYVWLMDGDLRFDMFSWDLYRTVLASLQPLVSQPAIVPKKPGKRSTDKHKLRMTGRVRGLFPIAREVDRTETMAVLVSTQLWPAMHERMQHSDLSTVWYLNDVWDLAAYMSAVECGHAGVLLVNAAPVRHMNYRDLFDADKVPERDVTCTRGCGGHGENCRALSAVEAQLLRDGLRGVCDIARSPGLSCTSNVSECREQLVERLPSREWVESTDGRVAALKYRCNKATGDWKTRLNDDCEAFE
mmetsp:Transcript_40270/g.108812  ORF Transcript_40270/g.108812 Transcript_40270/m.108812 type:complete len:428 (-) Transcript_40270:76-1359(-)